MMVITKIVSYILYSKALFRYVKMTVSAEYERQKESIPQSNERFYQFVEGRFISLCCIGEVTHKYANLHSRKYRDSQVGLRCMQIVAMIDLSLMS